MNMMLPVWPWEVTRPEPPLLPAVGELAQDVGGVVVARRRLHPQGVELLGFREHRADFGELRDDAAAIAVDADGAAFPVALAGFVGVLELTEQVIGDAVDARIGVLVAQALDAGYEARPGPALQLVEHRSIVLLHESVPH